MSCERYHEAISGWLDGTLDVVERREIEDHLRVCAGCAALASDLRRLRAAALELDRLTPPPGLWSRIEAAAEVPRRPARGRGRTWFALAAAAVLVIAVGLATFVRRGGEPPAATRETADSSPIELARTVEAELRLAEQHYENAIAGLERLARDRELLDPEVAATLQRNLQVIDVAIGESRSALQAQPGSHPAQQSLFDAFRTKIALLEDTIYLLSEIRRNSQASNGGADPQQPS